jgi:Rod binding domain-containing protein
MSSLGASLPAGVAPVNQALEPTWVRNGSAATQQAYHTALAFEEMLLEQLSGALTQDGLQGESEESGEEGAPKLGGGVFSSLLPQALSQGLVAGGGLGVADELTRELQARESLTQGTGASATASPEPTVVPTTAGGSASSSATGGTAA